MRKSALVLAVTVLGAISTISGCSPAARSTATAVVAGASAPVNLTSKIMLFGGLDHKTYLGCLNCSQYATDSVFNQYGQHGSRYAFESIWNHYGEYGSAYSTYGVCNAYASDPPVIVDNSGNYYGRLTLNTYHAEIGAGGKYFSWLKQTVCESE